MKNLHLLSFFIALLVVLSINLTAQTKHGRFNLKEGDWFRYRVAKTFDFNPKDSSSVTSFLSTMANTNFDFEIYYQLKKQDGDGNQTYKVEVERMQSKVYSGQMDMWFGYDSFYPPFKDDRSEKIQNYQFLMVINPDGDIIQFDSIAGNTSSISLSKILAQKETSIDVNYTINFPVKYLEFINSIIAFKPSKSGEKELEFYGSAEKMTLSTNSYNENDEFSTYNIEGVSSVNVVQTICLRKERLTYNNDFCYLIDASFPLPGNTFIKGKLTDQANKDISISLDGDLEEVFFQKKHFKTQSDGSFECRVFLNRPLYLKLDIGEKTMLTFIEPDDTLIINQIASRVTRVSNYGTFYDHPTHSGYLLDSDRFEGKAAYNAKLSVEMDEWLGYPPAIKSVETYLHYQDQITKSVNNLLNLYRGKASETCIDFLESRIKFFLAANKLYFKDNLETIVRRDLFTAMKNMEYKKDINYPADFFADVDTLSTVMYPYEWCRYYVQFLGESLLYRKERLEMQVGGLNDDFFGKYYFARSSLKGYPLYKALSEILDDAFRQGYVQTNKIEPYYQKFIKNCNDPALIRPLTKVYSTAKQFEIGKQLPIESLLLQDSSHLRISDYKGKPLCLVLLDARKSLINQMKDQLEKFRSEEIQFLFLVTSRYTDTGALVDSAILKRPNIMVLELADDNLKEMFVFGRSKIIVLDKWLRLVDDNVDNPIFHKGTDDFEKAIKKAIETKRFSNKERASIYKTAGWSLSSILFTLLVGLWFYRRRVQKLKRDEALKRQIKELEIKAIRSQMNPHFIFNALNSIQSLVNAHQYKETNIYLAKFSVLLRGVLNNSEKSMVSLSDEFEAVKLYCELEQLRFEFELVIEIAPEINADLIEVPGMIIQPLAENAVVHGLASLGNNGKLRIDVKYYGNSICIKVSDNGAGLVPSVTDKLSEKGFGLKLIKERLAILNHETNQAKLTVEKNSIGEGTMATLVIPID